MTTVSPILNKQLFRYEEETEGYICSLLPNNNVTVLIWIAHKQSKFLFTSLEVMYKEAHKYIKSSLMYISPMHKALHNVFQVFISYYDRLYLSL
jgi:hypothetical protein